jgi:hypothetical protein
MKMRTPIPIHYKQAVLRRQKNKCNVCCDVLDVHDIDHIVPYRVCREHRLSNLQALCPTCHARKTRSEARYLAEYVRCEQTISYRLCWGCKQVVSAYFGYENGYCSACSCIEVWSEIETKLTTYIFDHANVSHGAEGP